MQKERKCEMKTNPCSSCKYRIDENGWAACDCCIHNESLKDLYEPLTNADRTRNMTDEALAEELADYLCNKIQDIGLCEKYEECGQGCLVDYLRSPAESEGEE